MWLYISFFIVYQCLFIARLHDHHYEYYNFKKQYFLDIPKWIGVYDLTFPIILVECINREINSAAGHSNATYNSVSQTYGIVMPALPIPKHSHCLCLKIIESWSDLGEFIIMHPIYDIRCNHISDAVRSNMGCNSLISFQQTLKRYFTKRSGAIVRHCCWVYLYNRYTVPSVVK